MALPLPVWHVNQDVLKCRYAFFLSHVSDDKPFIRKLKSSLERRLQKAGSLVTRCFLEMHDWRRGCPPVDVIQDAVLSSVHFLIWVTPKDLTSSRRGWTWLEFAFAHQIERSRRMGHPDFYSPFIVPVFRNVKPQAVSRTPIIEYWHHNVLQRGDNDSPGGIAELLHHFYLSEEQRRVRLVRARTS